MALMDTFDHRLNIMAEKQRRGKERKEIEIRKKSKAKWPRLIWGTICFILCVLQLIGMTHLFCSHEMNVETLFLPEDPVIPATILLCAINAFKVPCDPSACEANALTSRSLIESSYGFEELVDQIMIISPSNVLDHLDGENLKAFYQKMVKRIRIEKYLCYSINMSAHFGDEQFRVASVKKRNIPFVAGLTFNSEILEKTKDMEICALLEDSKQIGYRLKGRLQKPMPGYTVAASYKRREMHLLPPPFKTNCRDYDEHGFLDEDACMRNCSLQYIIKKKLKVTASVAYEEVDDREFDSMPGQFQVAYNDSCERSCSDLPCTVVEILGQEVGHRKNPDNSTMVAVILPTDPFEQITYSQKMSMIEYLAFIGSILGLYLGLSALGLFDVLFALYLRHS